VLVVDDHELICSAISGLLEQQEDLLCCGQATTLREAEQAVIKLKPDLVLLDLRLGEEDGMRLTSTLYTSRSTLRRLADGARPDHLPSANPAPLARHWMSDVRCWRSSGFRGRGFLRPYRQSEIRQAEIYYL
jgi:hypothetical protein